MKRKPSNSSQNCYPPPKYLTIIIKTSQGSNSGILVKTLMLGYTENDTITCKTIQIKWFLCGAAQVWIDQVCAMHIQTQSYGNYLGCSQVSFLGNSEVISSCLKTN